MPNELIKIVDNFAGKRVAVVGDLMMDAYIFGNARRISPEAPVPVVETEREEYCLGGAGNVMRNVVTLGGRAVAYSVLGDDLNAAQVRNMLNDYGIDHTGVLVDPTRCTTRKQRVLAGGQQLLRIDYECCEALAEEYRQTLKMRLLDDIANDRVDAIIFEDYAKGVLSYDMMQDVVIAARKRNIITALDPKPGNLEPVRGITLMKPNRVEAFEMARKRHHYRECPAVEDPILAEVAGDIQREWEVELLLISLAAQGMALFRADEESVLIPTQAREVYDVSGAGDTVISTYTLALCAGADPVAAAIVANCAAGIVVGKIGTVAVEKSELIESLGGCSCDCDCQ